MKSARVLLVAVAALTLALGGCSQFPGKTKPAADKRSNSDKLSAAIANAARDAEDGGMTRESLMFQEKLYRQDPRNTDKIIAYARSLRRAGRVDDAQLVIRTPAKNARATEPLLTECAMVLIASGEYEEALDFAQKALEKGGKSPYAHHALALALSGLDKNADAQLQFEKTLELWPDARDTTPVINNLAMSLAAQGKIKEARSVMAMATGEALRSRTYQNNRAMLESLKDREIVAEKIAKPAEVTPEVTSLSPNRTQPEKSNAPAAKKAPRKMKPIIE